MHPCHLPHTVELYMASYNDTQHHSDGDIEYTFGNSRTMTTSKHQTHAHICKHKALDPQPHTHGPYHMPHQDTNILLILETGTAGREDAEQDNIACTTPPGPTLPLPPANDHRLPIL